MIILGIDPGTTIIGYGVVNWERSTATCLEYGVIRNSGKDKLADLQATHSQLGALIKKHRPDAAGIEKLFFANNQKTAISVSEMRGVLLLTLAQNGIPVSEFTPLQVKQYVSGYGKADKKQMQNIVKLLLKMKEDIKPDDAADAIAIALCCATTQRG